MKLRMVIAGLACAAAALGAPARAEREPRLLAEAVLVHADGSPAGTVRVLNGPAGSVLQVDASGMTPGPHGMHLHEIGQCAGPQFTSAGGHLNPEGHQHGELNPLGSHLGDLPNVTAGPDGRIKATIRTPMRPFKLVTTLLDGDGTALVLHAGPDDYKTDPAGNSGARVACGVFERR